jgi:outer membrane protein assembly factor BamB
MRPSGYRLSRVAIALIALGVVCLPARAAEPSPWDDARQHYTAILRARDALVKQLADRQAADARREPARDFSLTIHDAIVRRSDEKGLKTERRSDLECLVSRRGGQWFPGAGRARTFNLARHDVDPSGLALAGNRLTGTLKATLNPDPWVPPDHKPKQVWFEVAATILDGTIAGTHRGGGDYGPTEGKVSGHVADVADEVQAPTLAEEANLPADPSGALLRTAGLASRAYQQSRAAVLSLRHYPLSFAETLKHTTLAVPEWAASEEAPVQIRDYLAELRRLLEREVRSGGDAGAFVVESLDVADPFFGPYFDDEPLPAGAEGVAALPSDAGAGESQRWQRIVHWRTIAAFVPDAYRDFETPRLPEIVPAAGARYKPDAAGLGASYEMPKGGIFSWGEHEAPFRFIPPPGQPFDPVTQQRGRGQASGAAGVQGVDEARWYGFAQVESPRDVELYASAFGKDYGKLWVNGDLAWVSRMAADEGSSAPPLLKVRLRKGRNTFLFGCQSRRGASFFWVMLCTGGRPLSAEERAARREAQRKATASLPPDPRRGRRGDWTGRFPEADPPLGWDIANRVNLLWRTPLPDYSAANPVLVGDRLLVNCEPHTLYCLDKNTGKVLWKRDAHAFEFVPEDQRAAAMESWDAARAAEKSPQRRELEQQLAALADEQRNLEEAGQLTDSKEAEIAARMKPVRDALETLGSRSRLNREWRNRLGVREHGWANNFGYTFPAPCSNGKHVWVKYNTGVLACYDLDGNRRWIKQTRMSGGVPQLASPALADGKVIIQGQLSDPKEAKEFLGTMGSPVYFRHRMAAYDQQTGDLVWERPIWASGGYGSPGGFVPMRLSDGHSTRELLVTHTGLLVAPADGRLLCSALGAGKQGWYGDPFVAENRAYLYRSGPVWAVEVWLEPDGRVGSKVVLQAAQGGGYSGAVMWNGYVFGTSNHPSQRPTPWQDVHVADMRTGEVVGAIAPALREGGLPYTPSASARQYGVVTGTGCGGIGSWSIGGPPAEVGFLVPGPKPYMVGGGRLDAPMVAQPIFEGRRMYVRTYEAVLCIGIAGPQGEEFSLRRKAETILGGIPPRPSTAEVPRLDPIPGFTPPEGVPVEPCDVQTAPSRWLFVGPFDRQAGKDPLEGLGGPPKALLNPGQEISVEGRTLKVEALGAEFVKANKGWQTDLFGNRVYVASCEIDLVGPIGRRQNSTTYYYAVLHNKEDRVVVADVVGGSGIHVWLGGRPVRPGDRVRLPAGYHPLLLRADLAVVPPFVKKVVASLRLRDIEDPNKAYADWLGFVKEARPRIEEIIRERPGSEEARRARLILRYLNPEGDAPSARGEARPGSG